MRWAVQAIFVIWLVAVTALGEGDAMLVRVPISETSEIDIAEVVTRLAGATKLAVDRPPSALRLPIGGLSGALTFDLLTKSLGPDVKLGITGRELNITLPASLLAAEGRPLFERRLADLARKANEEVRRRNERYGMHALKSYRPNDPGKPTICLVHGLNSSSEVFVHMIGPLEQAGFGIVVYDYPYNRDLDASALAFSTDWVAFRRRQRETRPWAIVAHSMGALLARSYVEADPEYAGDVSSLIMVGPVNQGSGIANAQTLLQLVQNLQALNGEKTRALSQLSDGLGAAADDMMPGSTFLKTLNAHPRRKGVRYHTLAGDAGFLTPASRRQLETQLTGVGLARGVLGSLARRAADDLKSRLDEITEGRGDGCVSVAGTRLDGVSDHQIIHANHLELIRAPLLYPDPGPVVSMPFILRCLEAETPGAEPANGR
jgi:pimeloyl-ACP methyl ester carboxylesterase